MLSASVVQMSAVAGAARKQRPQTNRREQLDITMRRNAIKKLSQRSIRASTSLQRC
jgi:hypothetical protein